MFGDIVNPGMKDQLSVLGTTIFPQTPIGGTLLVLEGDSEGNRAIMTTNGQGKTLADGSPNPNILPIMIMDLENSEYAPVPGTNPVPPGIPSPTQIQRPELQARQNPRVFFGDGQGNHVRVAVSGDVMVAEPPTVPPLRDILSDPLTSPTSYPTIVIGSRTVL